ncbi:hypothetical protein ACFFLM_24980 [Deinococcus oregonensis]|uniref:DUF202 domain-containing protein n=1 Tax=Deinococcus oregonensis TaxID=1805970 RepID=A0ABV6B619_9DEIO
MNNLSSLTMRPQERKTYLVSCVRVSLIKRWYLLIGAVVVGAVLAFSFGLSRMDQILVGLLLMLGSAILIGLQSWHRHADDMPSSRVLIDSSQPE